MPPSTHAPPIYCVRCKSKTPTLHASLTTSRNGRHMLKGKCSHCGTTKNMFVAK